MTTCLWTGESLYVDSLISSSYLKQTKKFRIPDRDTLLFGSGHWNSINKVWDWLSTPESAKEPVIGEKEKNSFMVIRVTRSDDTFKLTTVTSDLYLLNTLNQVIVIGSGSEYAQGALEAGASTLKAMEIACKLDRSSGGPIYRIKWDEEHGFNIYHKYGSDINPVIKED